MVLKPGMIISFKKSILAFGGLSLVIKAHQPVKITKVNKAHIYFIRPDGKETYVRNIKGRQYLATKMGKILYG